MDANEVAPKPIRLILLLQDLEFGGTQRYAVNLLRYLDRGLFRPELWVLRGGFDMLEMAREAHVNITWLSRSSHVGPWSLLRLLLKLMRNRCVISYTLTVVPNIWGRIFGRIAGIPVIVSGYRSLVPRQHERWLWPLSSRIICNAQALKEIMIHRFSVDPDRIAVIPNGVDHTFFANDLSQRPADPVILFVGRLVEEKAPLVLLEAFRKVLTVFSRARLEIVGRGPLEKRIKALIRTAPLKDRVSLHPAAADIRPFLNRAWIFVMASVKEASPNVIIEAMASGLPVVATRVGGIPELVIEGRTGLLVDPGDTMGLAEALLSLLENDPLRNEMGQRARQNAYEHHSLERVVKQTEACLLEAAGGSEA